MFWKKKEEGKEERRLPDLPASKPVLFNERISGESEEEDFNRAMNEAVEENGEGEEFEESVPEEKHELPSFPGRLSERGFGQAAIKEAVAEEEQEEGSMKMTRSIDEKESLPEIPGVKEIEGGEKKTLVRELARSERAKSADIYVKLDKFYSAKKSINEIEARLMEIDELLKKIRETKMREEQELSGWEKEIDEAKGKVRNVRESIFEVD